MRCAAWPRAAARASRDGEEVVGRWEAGGRGREAMVKWRGLGGRGVRG